MSGIQITVTNAGRAALVNAENTGTTPVLVAQVGITATAFTPNASTSAIPGELKRLTTFAGVAVADDTIHVTLRDDSADVYSLRGFGLYLANGTLFAVYGQASPIMEKSAQAVLLLSADIRFVKVDATSLTFGDASFANPPASTTVPGVVRLATTQEGVDGTSTGTALAPAGLKTVLDARFGAGAPTIFVKGLLNVATAALFRTAIGLGNAALRDTGAGNGLDADLLDGQHGSFYRAWGNLTGVPSTFAPSAHNHPWGQVTGAPVQTTRWPTWLEVTDKPATFTPAPHSHAASDIVSGTLADARIPTLAIAKTSGLQAALDARAPIASPVFTGTPVANDGEFQVGSSTGNYVRLRFDGTMSFNGSAYRTLWHSANFNPANYAPLAGATFTGAVTGTRIVAVTPGFAPNAPDQAAFVAQGAYGGAFTMRDGTGRATMFCTNGGSSGFIFNFAVGTASSTSTIATLSPTGLVSSGGFQSGSSAKLKTALRPIPYGLAEVERIKVVVGRYRVEFSGDQRDRLFVIAEQVRKIVPEVVFDEAIEFDGELVAALDYQQLGPLLIRAVQQLAARVRTLERAA